MTWNRFIEVVVWAIGAGTILASIWAWSHPLSTIHTRANFVPALSTEQRGIDTRSVRSAAIELQNRNPFRMERSPTSTRFGSMEVAPAADVAEAHVSRPNLVLAGVIGGPPWFALVEGIPGREAGVALMQGEEVNGFRLVRLRGDTAVLSGLNTTWVLLPKQVWQ
jgi:hypothetical protein